MTVSYARVDATRPDAGDDYCGCCSSFPADEPWEHSAVITRGDHVVSVGVKYDARYGHLSSKSTVITPHSGPTVVIFMWLFHKSEGFFWDYFLGTFDLSIIPQKYFKWKEIGYICAWDCRVNICLKVAGFI